MGAARDAAYLTWRYRKHPVFEYRFVTVAEGGRTGLAVWRLEPIRRQTPEGRVDVDRIGRLVEFLPVSAENAEALFAAFIRELGEAGAMGADYYGYHSQTRGLAPPVRLPRDLAASGRPLDSVPLSAARRQGRRES